jgi:hypothetical protein
MTEEADIWFVCERIPEFYDCPKRQTTTVGAPTDHIHTCCFMDTLETSNLVHKLSIDRASVQLAVMHNSTDSIANSSGCCGSPSTCVNPTSEKGNRLHPDSWQALNLPDQP